MNNQKKLKRRQAKLAPSLALVSAGLRQMQQRADDFSLGDLDDECWFDFAHQHPDIWNISKRSGYARELTLQLGRQYLDKAMQGLRLWSKPSNCWCLIDLTDPSDDSVCYHSANPNPNGGKFPFSFAHVRWNEPVPERIRAVYPASDYLIGVVGHGADLRYWVIANTPGEHVNAGEVEAAQHAEIARMAPTLFSV